MVYVVGTPLPAQVSLCVYMFLVYILCAYASVRNV